MLLKVYQHGCLEPPTGPEDLWPSQTHFFDDYQGQISRAVAHWLRIHACMCMSECDSLRSCGLTADCMHCYSYYTPITSEDMQHAAARHVHTDQNPIRIRFECGFTSCFVCLYHWGKSFLLFTCDVIPNLFPLCFGYSLQSLERNKH